MSTEPDSTPGRDVSVAALTRVLRVASLLYLGVPMTLFLASWTWWPIALPVTTLFLLGAWRYASDARRCETALDGEPTRVSWRTIVASAVLVLAALATVGIGGLTVQNPDWAKHNMILDRLIAEPWPVHVEADGQWVPLVYYVGFYLPAAVVGKLAGWTAAAAAIDLWTACGALLGAGWVLVLSGRARWWVVAALLCYSGWDAVGYLIVNHRLNLTYASLDFWARIWQYTSTILALDAVPQHVLVSWIGTAMMLDSARHAPLRHHAVIILALTTIWSPFVSIGLAAYAAATVLMPDDRWVYLKRAATSASGWAAIAAVLVVGAYLTATRVSSSNAMFVFAASHGRDVERILSRLLLFLVLDAGVLFTLPVVAYRHADRPMRALTWITAGLLFGLPLIRFGLYNDLCMRASMPPLFVLFILNLRSLWTLRASDRRRLATVLAVIVFGVGVLTPFAEITRKASKAVERGVWVPLPPHDEVIPFEKLTWHEQYIGRSDAPFFRWMARPIGPGPDEQ
ncbi:MAG: hypothetical protein GC159_04190 [Phycisphaera sp.]|nr:hypothetical protein [Phycisphaera sp.]